MDSSRREPPPDRSVPPEPPAGPAAEPPAEPPAAPEAPEAPPPSAMIMQSFDERLHDHGGEAGGGSPDAAFAPPEGTAWYRVSRRYTWHRRITVVLWAVPIALVGALIVAQSGGPVGAGVWLLAVVISCGLGWIVTELAYRSWGFAERPDDLLVTNGVFVRRLVVVPYGRMQFVDVTAGLLEQWLGVATVRLHTAAAATDARIPGLPAAEAAGLRDRLAQRGEARAGGL
ncbi:PH domain-containing protein [Actinomadura scrupuli]|uniref:PH domain-containing protein n=1 Tax=Actinomadura scrupuli TaxID=559629 RepID=UPI003D993DBB